MLQPFKVAIFVANTGCAGNDWVTATPPSSLFWLSGRPQYFPGVGKVGVCGRKSPSWVQGWNPGRGFKAKAELSFIHYRCNCIYKSFHGLAPQCLVDDATLPTCDFPGKRRLRSASCSQPEVPRTRLVTVGYRTFRAAGSRLWNSLVPQAMSLTLDVFRQKLRRFLFSLFFPGHCLSVCFSNVDIEVFDLGHAEIYIH